MLTTNYHMYLKQFYAVLAWLMINPAMAQFETCNKFGHFDLDIKINPPASNGGKILIDPALDFPLNINTGSTVVPADFGDFAGGPHKTDDPGWKVTAGDLLAGENLWFRALGILRYWDPIKETWGEPPNNERVRYFGATPAEVFLRNDPDELAFYQEGTIWTTTGLTGPTESPIDQAAADGSIHTHLDFCVEAEHGDCSQSGVGHTGNPSIGAYLIEVQLFSDAGSKGKYIKSRPIQLVLNNGLVDDQCGTAIAALTQPSATDTSVALPAAGILIMSGN